MPGKAGRRQPPNVVVEPNSPTRDAAVEVSGGTANRVDEGGRKVARGAAVEGPVNRGKRADFVVKRQSPRPGEKRRCNFSRMIQASRNGAASHDYN